MGPFPSFSIADRKRMLASVNSRMMRGSGTQEVARWMVKGNNAYRQPAIIAAGAPNNRFAGVAGLCHNQLK
jgi:hypothetical protein